LVEEDAIEIVLHRFTARGEDVRNGPGIGHTAHARGSLGEGDSDDAAGSDGLHDRKIERVAEIV
jgi:hypothetical protein